MIEDLRGKVYARELMRKTGFSDCLYASWKNAKELTRVGRYYFIGRDDLPEKHNDLYKQAFDKCQKFDNLYPVTYFAESMSMEDSYFHTRARKRDNLWKFVEVDGVKFLDITGIADEARKYSTICLVSEFSQIEPFDHYKYLNGSMFCWSY